MQAGYKSNAGAYYLLLLNHYTIRPPTMQYGFLRIAYYSIQRSESYGHADWCHAAFPTNQNVRLIGD